MNALSKPLWELADFADTKDALNKKEICVAVSGCNDSQKVHMIQGMSDGFRMKIIATFSDRRVKELVEDLRLYDRNVYSYPDRKSVM